jgi:hypothetical protein
VPDSEMIAISYRLSPLPHPPTYPPICPRPSRQVRLRAVRRAPLGTRMTLTTMPHLSPHGFSTLRQPPPPLQEGQAAGRQGWGGLRGTVAGNGSGDATLALLCRPRPSQLIRCLSNQCSSNSQSRRHGLKQLATARCVVK